jgi:hypothetical protein
MSRPPSPDTQIATAPASMSLQQDPTPTTAHESTVRHGHPAIRAPASYRVAAVAGPSGATKTARQSGTSHSVQAQITRRKCQVDAGNSVRAIDTDGSRTKMSPPQTAMRPAPRGSVIARAAIADLAHPA